jgi:hypothetical protein
MKTHLYLFFVLILVNGALKAQDDSTGKQKMKFSPGIQFISNQTYAGRTDSLPLPVLIPSFSLVTPIGFYAKVEGYYNLSSSNSGFDGISIEPGYEISKKHWDISFSLIKNFISDSSNLIIAPIKTSLEFYAGNRNKVINSFAGAEYLFTSEGNDAIVYGGVSKDLLFTKKDNETTVSLEPSFSLTGGTQIFYYSYLKNYSDNGKSKAIGRGRSRGNIPSIPVSQTIQQEIKMASENFSLLSAEAELPLTISKGKFDCIIDPCWVSPVTLVNNNATGTQQSKAYVYLNIELSVNF